MSNIVERLTEGVVNRDMRAESHALLSKWKKTGLLEGIETERKQNSMARLLENQAKELLREANTMSGGSVEGFAAVAFPIVRRVFAGLIANDLVSVQPMSLPSGLIFFLDFTYSGDLGGTTDDQLSRFGNIADKSIYGTDRVGAQVTGGVNLVDSFGGDLSGPRTAATRGFAYASPTGSSAAAASNTNAATVTTVIKLDGVANLTETQKAVLDYDPDLLALTDKFVIVLDVVKTSFADGDEDNYGAYSLVDIANQADTTGLAADLNAGALTVTAITNLRAARRLTKKVGSDTRGAPFQSGIDSQAEAVRFYIISNETQTEHSTPAVVGAALPAGTTKFPLRDQIDAVSGAPGAVVGATPWGLEGNADIPEIDIKVDSIAVTAQTKKLKAKWTPELGQDLNAYHNLDAEVELTSLLSEQIALEIDREILADLVNGATAATRYWSRAPFSLPNQTQK